MFKKWASLLVLFAFVVTTMPTVAHAAMHQAMNASSVKTEKAEKHNCHNAKSEEAGKTDPKADDSNSSKKCCEKVCKCVGGSCNSSVQTLGSNGLSIAYPSLIKSWAGHPDNWVASGLASRIKRPPRV